MAHESKGCSVLISFRNCLRERSSSVQYGRVYGLPYTEGFACHIVLDARIPILTPNPYFQGMHLLALSIQLITFPFSLIPTIVAHSARLGDVGAWQTTSERYRIQASLPPDIMLRDSQ